MNGDAAVVAIVVAVGAVAAIGAAVLAGMALDQIQKTHQLINSRMDELLDAARALARAEGVAQGEQAERERETA
jgi:hypothetical protein